MLNLPATAKVIFVPPTIETPLAKEAVLSGTRTACARVSGVLSVVS